MIGWSWRKLEVETMEAGNGVARNKFWLGDDVRGVEVHDGVGSSG